MLKILKLFAQGSVIIFLMQTQTLALAASDVPPLESKSPDPIETIIVSATRQNSTAAKHPEVYVIDQDMLYNTQLQHIQELLATVPGVHFQRGNGQEYLPAIRSPVFTGAGSCGALLTAEDGIPVRSAGFCNVNELFEAHTEAAEHIEVVRGSGSALYGSNALHGMLNVITPQAHNTAKKMSLEYGADNYTRLKLASPLPPTYASDKQFAAFLTLTHDGGFREESGYNQQKLSLKYNAQFENKNISAGLTTTNLNQETAGFITGLDAYKDKALAESNPTPEAFRHAQSRRAWLRWEQTLNNKATFIITPYVRDTDMQFLQHFLPGDPLEENAQSSIGFQSAYYFQMGDSTQIISGIDSELTKAFLRQSQDQPTQGSAFLVETIPVGQHYDYEVDAKTLAAFVYADLEFAPQWGLISGLRFEHVDYAYDNKMLDGRTRDDGTECVGGCRYSRPADSLDNFDNFSSHVSLSYQATDKWSTTLKAAKSYRVPQATELYRLQREQSNADLESETLQGLELATTLRLETLKLNAALYTQKKDNHIFRDSDFFNVSNGKTTHQGIELYANYQVGNALSVALNANFAKHRYNYDQVLNGVNINGNDIDTAPREFGSIVFDWTISPHITSQLEYLHMGDYYLDPENLYTYAGHNLINLRAQWQIKPGWQLALRANNALDTAYAERADYTSFSNERYFPGRGRSVFMSVEKVF